MRRVMIRVRLLANRWSVLAWQRVRPWLEWAAAVIQAGLERLPACRLPNREAVRVALVGLWAGWSGRWLERLAAARTALRPEEIKRRFRAARLWAVEHDTVPAGEAARRRDWWIERRYRREQRAIDRLHRQEELTKKREKKEEEERQTYAVYFE